MKNIQAKVIHVYPPSQEFLNDGKIGKEQQLGNTIHSLNDDKMGGKEQQQLGNTTVEEQERSTKECLPDMGGKEIDSLYAENSKLKESVLILEKSLTDITKAFDAIRDSLSNHEVKIKNQLLQLDQKFDNKLLMYNQELQTEFKREINNVKQSMRDKVNTIEERFKSKVTEMEIATQNELSNSSSLIEENTKLKDQLTNMESDLAKGTDRIKDLESEVEQQSVRMEHLATEAKEQRNFIKNLQLQIAEAYDTREQQHPEGATQSINRVALKTKPSTFSGATYANVTMQVPTSQSSRSDRSLLVLMDSNRRYVNKDMLWRSSNISGCNTLAEAVNIIPSLTTHPQTILIHA